MSHRIKQTGEIFTPPALVDEIIEKLPPELFIDPSKTFIDPAAGDGEFLRGIVRKLMQTHKSFDFNHTFNTQLYGTELMWDNVCDTIYFLFTTSYSNEDKNKQMRQKISGNTPVIEDGFDDFDTSTSTPNEINDHFVNIRKYKVHNVKLWIRRYDNHRVEYTWSDDIKWIVVDHIIRANALTEWDYDKWKPLDEDL